MLGQQNSSNRISMLGDSSVLKNNSGLELKLNNDDSMIKKINLE